VSRSTEELKKLVTEFNHFHNEDFGIEIQFDMMKVALCEVITERIKKFINKRYGHLPDKDFLRFSILLLNDKTTKKT